MAPDLAHQHGEDDRDREAEDEREHREPGGVADGDPEQRVGEHALEVLEADERSARMTRFVSWTLMTNARTIGNHANSPKMTRNGSRNDERAQAVARQRGAGRLDGARVVLVARERPR